MSTTDTHSISLRSGELSLDVVPVLGGSLLGVRWGDVLLTRTLRVPLEQATVSHMSSFVMAPFANRIDAGRFSFDGRAVSVPINRPTQNVAIHGLVRNRAWSVVSQDTDSLVLALRVMGPDYPFQFEARQTYRVSERAWSIGLEIKNCGPVPLPYGIGHHPYFRCRPDTVVRLLARGHFDTDAQRNLPIAASAAADAAQIETRLAANESVGLDRHYYGWSGAAVIDWPDLGVALEVSADPTLANAHLYFPPDEDALCVEPVSHVPDVHNHPEWLPYGGLTVLAPGETLAGLMYCRVRGP